MTLEPHITFEQFKAAVTLMERRRRQRRRTSAWITVLPPLLGVIVGLGIAMYKPARIPAASIAVFVVVFWIVVRLRAKPMREKRLRRLYEGEQPRMNSQMLTLDEQGLRSRQKDGSSYFEYQWRAFICALEAPEFFLLLTSPNCYYQVPKAGVTVEEQKQIRRWTADVPETC